MYKAKARLSFSEPRPSRSSFVLLRADAQHCAHATVRKWLAQIGLRTTPGTRRKLQPPACCNKLRFSSSINGGPWTRTSPEATRQHSRTRNKALEAISWHSHVTSMMGLAYIRVPDQIAALRRGHMPQELQATVTKKGHRRSHQHVY